MRSISRLETATIQANFPWTFVRVYANDDAGMYGTGECFFAPGLEAIIRELGSLLVGEDYTAIDALVEKMRSAASGAGSQGGIIWNAISGIEAALYDLKGKRFGIPLYQLLGGKCRDSIAVYLDCHANEGLEALDSLLRVVTPSWSRKGESRNESSLDSDAVIVGAAERARHMVQTGYHMLKFDLDVPGSSFTSSVGYPLSRKELDWMIRLVAAIRDGVGDEVDIAFDAHWRYRASDMAILAAEITEYRARWLEDPVPPWDFAGLAQIRAHATTPIATGENLQLRSAFSELLSQGVCDVATPDVQKAGGLSETRIIGAIAAMHNVPLALHMIGSPLALLTSVHVGSTLSNFIACEFHGLDVPFYWDLVDGGKPDWFSPGSAYPTEAPGIGIELDANEARKYCADGSRWFDE